MAHAQSTKIERFYHFVDHVSDVSGKWVSFTILLIAFIVGYEVVMRRFFDRPTIWVHETTQYLFGFYFLLGGAYTLYKRLHVNVDVLSSRWKKRTQTLVNMFSSICILIVSFLLTWLGWKWAMYSLSIGETSSSPWDPPIYPVKFIVPVAGFLLLLQVLADFLRDLHSLRSERESK